MKCKDLGNVFLKLKKHYKTYYSTKILLKQFNNPFYLCYCYQRI